MQLQEAMEYFGGGHGSKLKIARSLGITPQAVYRWKNRIPLVRQVQLENISKSKLKAGYSTPYRSQVVKV